MNAPDNPPTHSTSSRSHGYWKSLERVPLEPASPPLEGVPRRDFMRLMGASVALAGAAGCTHSPPEAIVPYVKAPEELLPGEPLYFATALSLGGYALGVLVESHEGRPTKIEGNPDHPASLGATDAFSQAAVLGLYDPDRSQTVLLRGVIETWDRFLTTMTNERERWRASRGAGLRILTETVTSPTLAEQLADVLKDLPNAQWHQYEPAGLDNVREGARLAFDKYIDPAYYFDRADVILSLDADFLSSLPGSVRYARDFIDRRRVVKDAGRMNRLYVAESTPTITGAIADHRVPLRASQIEALARQLASKLGVKLSDESRSDVVPADLLAAVVGDLQSHRGTSLVIAGAGQPPVVHALVHAINDALGNLGQALELLEPVVAEPQDQLASLKNLVRDMSAGQVDTLLILGSNPVYNAPGELGFAEALAKVRLRIHLSEYNDETSFLCDWHIPAAHALEAWSDVRAFDGTTTITQPLIAPLYDGKTAHEIVAILQGHGNKSSYDILQDHWKTRLKDDFDRQWRRAIHDGVVPESKAARSGAGFQPARDDTKALSGQAGSLPHNHLEIEFRPDPNHWDGRFANNAWLQELPKPLTKLTWDNVAQVSPATAEQLQLTSGDVVQITVVGRTISAPIWITPGQSDGCVSLTFGYGRTRAGQIGNGVGYNAYEIRPAQAAWFTTGTVTKTGKRHRLVTTQEHHGMEGRNIVRVATFKQVQDEHRDGGPLVEKLPSLYPDHDYPGNAWGMVIDQTACIGCNACVVACQSENNIPIVGKEQVAKGREMHWLRIDRYYHGDDLANPATYFQPMMCVHCEAAPCEVVCPVAATVHDSEGTNNMVYNRCVGTRYCSNNCPYKVRRFNFLQFSDETTPSLQLLRNPDVTVRSRGVMEKCTYCIQRINLGRIDAKKQDRFVGDGEVVTACQQACPTRAITFGNLNARPSEVTQLKQSPLNYSVLGELNTRPRTTYLTRVVNPHPDLPLPEATQRHEEPT
jgi:molybdopterin-containing oxidoreductase family iron-sulfur binding subunit